MRLFGVAHHVYLYLIQYFSDHVVVNSPAGPVQGIVLKSVTGRNVYAFRGIPYGKPPVGALRFEPPEPAEPWNEPLDARSDHPGCLRLGFYPLQGIRGKEDCLILNIYTPQQPNNQFIVEAKLPVLVYIHGGSFTIGESDSFTYNPGFLMEYPMVLVTIGYRLGAFGFLSTEDEKFPGNMGLKDQILALKWIQNNIGHFGGDHGRVTLMGESAGGAAVHLLMLSPETEGLFHRAISQSGTGFSPSMKYGSGVGKHTVQLAKKFNCPTDSSKSLVNCLRQQKGESIVQVTSTLPDWGLFPFSFTPRVDNETNRPIVPDDPLVLYQKGKVRNIPWLCGQNLNEGLFWTVQKKIPYDELTNADKEEFNRISGLIVGTNTTNQTVDFSTIRSLYYQPGVLPEYAFSEFITDAYFLTGTDYGGKWHSKVADTYMYVFTHRGRYSITGFINPFSSLSGVAHADELQYLFGPNYLIVPFYKGSDEYMMMKMMTKAWFEFVKTGTPVMKDIDVWPKHDVRGQIYVNITLKPSVGAKFKEKQTQIWETLLQLPNVD